MSADSSRVTLIDRVWSRLARPQSVGIALVVLGLVAGLRAWTPSDESTILVRVLAVVAFTCALASVLQAIRPTPRAVAALSERGFVRAWWYPYYEREMATSVAGGRARWWTHLSVYALVTLVPPVMLLLTSVSIQPAGELMLIPGQGSESYLTAAPEPGLRQTLGYKLELAGADLDGVTPRAVVRATDMTTLTASDIELRSAEAARIRSTLVALRELRPLGGIGRLQLAVEHDGKRQDVTLERQGSVDLNDGSVLRWTESTSMRLGTLGPAVQLTFERDGEVLERRWVYMQFPELDALVAEGGRRVEVLSVERPLAALLSVRHVQAAPWGVLASILGGLTLLLLLLSRLLNTSAVGRDGDYMVLTPANASARARVVAHLRPEVAETDGAWIQPVREEEL